METDKYIKYISESIDNVCPYDDANRQRLYHIGFMQAILARLMREDSKNLHIFKQTIEKVEDGRKE